MAKPMKMLELRLYLRSRYIYLECYPIPLPKTPERTFATLPGVLSEATEETGAAER